jgi:hypothetical protein
MGDMGWQPYAFPMVVREWRSLLEVDGGGQRQKVRVKERAAYKE